MSYSSAILAETSLTNYWQLAETSGTVAVDSKSTYDGTYANCTLNQTGFGLTGPSVQFNGTSSQVSGSIGATIDAPYSIELLFNAANNNSDKAAFSTRTGGKTFLDIDIANGKIHCDIGNASGWINLAADYVFSYSINTWYHLVLVVSTTSYTIYLNSSLVAFGSLSGTARLWDSASTFTIGQTGLSGSNEWFNGYLSNVSIYNTALSASQVVTHYGAISTTGAIRETQQPLRAIVSPSNNNIRSTQQPLRAIVSPTNNIRSTQLALRVIHQNITGSLILVPMNGLNINSRMTGGMN